MESGVEIRKVDAQGRVMLPPDWRKNEVTEDREVIIVKRRDYLKIIPKRRADLTIHFDKVDLGVNAIEDWGEFEDRFYGAVK
ncbi:hypothetical protein JXL21_14185 [Candidatus Bathyarchaeota archaeon]|nr:hypothetical protein [Candidatus Bathyarchaeota archaeon]